MRRSNRTNGNVRICSACNRALTVNVAYSRRGLNANQPYCRQCAVKLNRLVRFRDNGLDWLLKSIAHDEEMLRYKKIAVKYSDRNPSEQLRMLFREDAADGFSQNTH